ncbi:hypothetical protein RSAG8_03578, partial [Rhizoctonia solani AG-8 WAC10335]
MGLGYSDFVQARVNLGFLTTCKLLVSAVPMIECYDVLGW